MSVRGLLAVLAVVGAGCTHTPSRCAFGDFRVSPYDHIIEQIGPFEVRDFRGEVSSVDIIGAWPGQIDASFEVHGPGGFVTVVPIRDRGVFEGRLKSGTYCFKLSAEGFRSMLGTVTINRKAPEHKLMIPMIIAE